MLFVLVAFFWSGYGFIIYGSSYSLQKLFLKDFGAGNFSEYIGSFILACLLFIIPWRRIRKRLRWGLNFIVLLGAVAFVIFNSQRVFSTIWTLGLFMFRGITIWGPLWYVTLIAILLFTLLSYTMLCRSLCTVGFDFTSTDLPKHFREIIYLISVIVLYLILHVFLYSWYSSPKMGWWLASGNRNLLQIAPLAAFVSGRIFLYLWNKELRRFG